MDGPQRPAPSGLASADVTALRARWGENRLPTEEGVSVWRILANQMKSPLIFIILAAAAISLALGEVGDAAVIMVVVVADVALGFVQEFQAQRTYVALKGLLKPTATVIRDGRRAEVEVWELVPGDLVVLGAGDRTPADGAVIEATRLAADEAILTGESEPVTKQVGTNACMGSTVVTGRGLLLVTATGTRTELGQIAASLGQQSEEATPLQRRLGEFSRVLTWIVVGATAVILGTGLAAGREFFDMLRIAIILAIAAVPEGLIIAVTVILVLGMRQVLRREGLVKRLLAVETLGSVTIICTDKTGTLTQGRMRVQRTELADPELAWQAMVLCNNLDGPVDVALWEYAEQAMPGRPQALVDASQRLAEELFTSETKYMIAAVTSHLVSDDPGQAAPERGSGRPVFFLKGAPEIVVGMCAMSQAEQAVRLAEFDRWAAEGLRLIALAFRHDGTLDDYTGYTWLGLLGLDDPVRAGVPEAVELARRAGIRTTMLTGDYRRTAESIAARIGLATEPVLEGADVAAMTDDDLRREVGRTAVFARIRPQDKLRIVRALQANGEITAMIGDGVNDAPALMHSDIGVVVGTATDVAKESADLILLDSNFATVVAAVEEGRVIFDNIRKVVAYVLSNSFAEVLAIFGAMLLGWPAPLLVSQILWIHLICDGPSDIVLGFEPKEVGVMDRRPRALSDPVLDRLGGSLIAAISLSSAVFALVLFRHFLFVVGDPAEGRSIVFASFALNSVIYIFAYRSLRLPLWKMNPLTANKPLLWAVGTGILTALLPFWIPSLGAVLEIVPLSLLEWSWVAGFALALLGIVELAKAVAVRTAPSGT